MKKRETSTERVVGSLMWIISCRQSRRRNKLMEGEVAREVARMKMAEMAQRMKSRMHALKLTKLEKAFDSLCRAYQVAEKQHKYSIINYPNLQY